MDYRQLAYQTAQKYGIDPDLFVRQIQAESAFRPDAVSSAGAIGLGQLMPATAKELGVDPTDPVQNLEGAARYMKQQLDRFGDPALALAAYNAGPSRVAKAGGVPNITETQNYVAKILGGKGGAAMAQEPQKPQGLLGGLLGGQGIGERLGLSPEFSDKLAMAVMAGSGDARLQPLIAQRAASMKERKAEAKEQRQRNKSLEYLKQRADAGDAMAGQIYGAVSTGVLPVGAGLSTYLTQSLKGQTVTDTADYKNYLEFKKTNPDITFEEFYTNFKNKPDIQNKGVYRDKSGNIIGEVNFDKSTGQFFQFDVNGQRQILDMKELTPVTDATFANTIPKYNDFVKLSEGLQDDIGSLRQLEKYMTAINNTNEGFARLADDLSASAKTLLSSYFGPEYTNLSKEELALRVGRGLQQGLIGRFRIETVGGGVMTEQDALRIIQNLGGDVSLLQNKEVVAKQIQNLFEAKKSSFDRRKKRHDIALNQIYKDQGFEEIQPYEFDESVFNLKGSVSDTKTTMTDDQLLSGAQGKAGDALKQYLQSLSEADFNRLMQLQQADATATTK
jgi:hypothetical protein